MIDVLGNKLKKGDVVIMAPSASHEARLLPGIILNITKDSLGREKIKVARAVGRGVGGKRWQLMTSRSNSVRSSKICKLDKVPDQIFAVLDMAYEVYWEPR